MSQRQACWRGRRDSATRRGATLIAPRCSGGNNSQPKPRTPELQTELTPASPDSSPASISALVSPPPPPLRRRPIRDLRVYIFSVFFFFPCFDFFLLFVFVLLAPFQFLFFFYLFAGLSSLPTDLPVCLPVCLFVYLYIVYVVISKVYARDDCVSRPMSGTSLVIFLVCFSCFFLISLLFTSFVVNGVFCMLREALPPEL